MERMMEPHLCLGFARIVLLLVLLPHWTLLKHLLCSVQNPKWVSYGEYLGNQACKWQPGCREPQLLPLVSRQLPSTPCMEFSCSRDLALQHLCSVAILSGCQGARKECKQEKGNRDLKNIFFFILLIAFHLNLNKMLRRKDIRTWWLFSWIHSQSAEKLNQALRAIASSLWQLHVFLPCEEMNEWMVAVI